MKLARIALGLIIVLVIVTPSAAQDWKGRGRLAGQVVDENDQPIAGATVKIWFGSDESDGPPSVVTKENGRFGFLGIGWGTWTVSVNMDGKMPSQGQVQVTSISKPVPVTLREIPEEMLYAEGALEAQKLLDEGNRLLESGDPGTARAKYQEGMAGLKSEHHADILVAIATTYSHEGDTANALSTLEQALEQSAGNPKVLLELARAHYQVGDIEKAISGLEQLIEIEPDNQTVLRVISDMLVGQGRVDEAEKYIARLPEGTKLDPNALLNVGIDQYNNGEMEKAFEQFDKVVREYPEMAMAYYYRGVVFLGRGSNEEAAADLKRFIELEPESDKAVEAREFLSYLEPQS
jgi:tetratricopeptide (TPR) repeat protein